MAVQHGLKSSRGFKVECVCGICMHWDSDQCDKCDCCMEMHKRFASDKHSV